MSVQNDIVVLGFDYGLARIGVAVGQTLTQTATPIAVLPAKDGIPNWQSIQDLIQQWRANHLIVGLPLNMDDTESEIALRAKKFGKRLHGRFGLPVEYFDERLSTREAKERANLLENGFEHQKKPSPKKTTTSPVDAIAAQIILENWLTQPK